MARRLATNTEYLLVLFLIQNNTAVESVQKKEAQFGKFNSFLISSSSLTAKTAAVSSNLDIVTALMGANLHFPIKKDNETTPFSFVI